MPIPDQGAALTQEEELQLTPIINALAQAAITTAWMKDRIVVATLKKVAKNPSLVLDGRLPGAVLWEIATDYQRDNEKHGTFSLDIYGDEQSISGHQFQKPTEANIKKAAKTALARVSGRQTSGRPPKPANEIIGLGLGPIFCATGQSTGRRWEPEMRDGELVWVERGPFHDFLRLILPTLNSYLKEQELDLVTVETVVRCVNGDYVISTPRLTRFLPPKDASESVPH
jgi:hypothetical protein